jgi:hypothetical protein
VVEGRDRPRLTLEALAQLRIRRQRLGENLDGDGAIEPGIARPIHFAHSTGTDGGEDFIRTEANAGFQAHGADRL